jgi:hypothetical protein
MSKARTIDLGIWLTTTWEFNWNGYVKSLTRSLKSKGFWKCLKTIPKRPPIERCKNNLKSNLKESKKNSKFELNGKSTKGSKQGEDKFDSWNTYKTLTIFKEVKGPKGPRALARWAYSLTYPRARFCQSQHIWQNQDYNLRGIKKGY